MSPTESPLLDAVTREIEALHRFFVGWFTGAIPADADLFDEGLTHRLDPDFKLVPPAGRMSSFGELTGAIRAGYGNNPNFVIQIRKVAIQRATDELVVATYEEWQRNAKASTPPDNGRVASVVFAREGERLRWVLVHETWLPREVMEADAFDF